MTQPENPFDVLPLGRQIRRENLLLGVAPWVAVMGVELVAIYLARWSSVEILMSRLFILELIVFPFLMGIMAVIQTYRTYKNLWSQVSFEEVAVTHVRPENALDWLMSNSARAQRYGIMLYIIFIAAALGGLLLAEEIDGFYAGILAALAGARLMPTRAFGRYSTHIGISRYFSMKSWLRAWGIAFLAIAVQWLTFLLCCIAASPCLAMGTVGALGPGDDRQAAVFATFGMLLLTGWVSIHFSRAAKRIHPKTLESLESWWERE